MVSNEKLFIGGFFLNRADSVFVRVRWLVLILIDAFVLGLFLLDYSEIGFDFLKFLLKQVILLELISFVLQFLNFRNIYSVFVFGNL